MIDNAKQNLTKKATHTRIEGLPKGGDISRIPHPSLKSGAWRTENKRLDLGLWGAVQVILPCGLSVVLTGGMTVSALHLIVGLVLVTMRDLFNSTGNSPMMSGIL